MPDGAKDRPTRGHEYLFLLTKSPKYFYDYYRVLEDTEEQPEQVQGFGRSIATSMPLRNYEKIVEILGGYGEMVTEPTEIVPALRRAFESGVPACVNVVIKSLQCPYIAWRHSFERASNR